MSKKHSPAKAAGGTQHGGKGYHHVATVGKPAHHHKPAKAPAHKGGAGAAGHKAGRKHQAASKKHHPKRGFSLGDVACCAAEALAMSLRLAGYSVADDEALALYWRTASDPDAGASIRETLEAAAEFGLAGVSPRRWGRPAGPAPSDTGASLILGVDLPGPHAVLATADGWWSWGELHQPFPGAVIEEAWAVTWQ